MYVLLGRKFVSEGSVASHQQVPHGPEPATMRRWFVSRLYLAEQSRAVPGGTRLRPDWDARALAPVEASVCAASKKVTKSD